MRLHRNVDDGRQNKNRVLPKIRFLLKIRTCYYTQKSKVLQIIRELRKTVDVCVNLLSLSKNICSSIWRLENNKNWDSKPPLFTSIIRIRKHKRDIYYVWVSICVRLLKVLVVCLSSNAIVRCSSNTSSVPFEKFYIYF